MDKITFKKRHKQCAICEEENYAILDVHRIHEGKEYSNGNCVVLCCKCHRMHHAGQIKIVDKRYSTTGSILFYEIDGREFIKEI
jgi:hypothetical protein